MCIAQQRKKSYSTVQVTNSTHYHGSDDKFGIFLFIYQILKFDIKGLGMEIWQILASFFMEMPTMSTELINNHFCLVNASPVKVW